MSSKLKIIQVSGALLVLLVGLLFVEGTLFLVRALPLTLAKDVPTLLGRVGIALGASLVCVVIFEGAAFQVKQSLAMNARNVETPDRNVYERIATVNQYTDLAETGLRVLLPARGGPGRRLPALAQPVRP